MDQKQLRTLLIDTFNTVSGEYDAKALRFFPDSAGNMARMLGLRGNEQVLDVACGTGHTSVAIARLLPAGRVTAVDFSSGMLAQARQKASALHLSNIEFNEQDMQNLIFPENTFDCAVCAFGIFFVMDMEKQLKHISTRVKRGGKIMISNFQENYFSPFKELFFDRIAGYGVPNPPQTWRSIAHEQGCRELFQKAGLIDISVESRNVGYFLDSADDWWSIVWNAGLRRMVSQLSSENQQRFKQEHLQEIEALRTEKGIWLDVAVLYTTGTKL
jgi:ubiquinone/menaquinone biosynthesis C-methylase UbiE